MKHPFDCKSEKLIVILFFWYMVYCIADNIISPLGLTSRQNYKALLEGRSSIEQYPKGYLGIPDGFCGSLLSHSVNPKAELSLSADTEDLTRLEKLVVQSVQSALDGLDLDISSERVVLIFATTKGNLEGKREAPGACAAKISEFLGIKSTPITVCNACISGVNAIILAERLLESAKYDFAVVCGGDIIGKFIISGFETLKALSPMACKPFDIERLGLNLGEAAATMVLSRNPSERENWGICNGAIRNDASHITTPSKTGDGALNALKYALQDVDIDELAFVNAHGTATMFNDQMEGVAIERAGLCGVEVNALKGYFGHTMGAAGIVETIISMRSLDDGKCLATKGFEEIGVSAPLHITSETHTTEKRSFIKMISGFGGGNAAIFATKHSPASEKKNDFSGNSLRLEQLHTVKITPRGAVVDGENIALERDSSDGNTLLTSIYKQRIGDYPKFYKMDPLAKLGFVASELLLQKEGGERFVPREDRAIILFNQTSSQVTDAAYTETIAEDNYYPSPALFVYTLPNIAAGEIALRNNYKGESSFYILPQKDKQLMDMILEASLLDRTTKSMVAGWIDYANPSDFEAELSILKINNKE